MRRRPGRDDSGASLIFALVIVVIISSVIAVTLR